MIDMFETKNELAPLLQFSRIFDREKKNCALWS